MEFDDDRSFEQDPEEYDWRSYGEHEETTVSLQGKDYLAIFLASLQTIFLPLIILIIVLFSFGLIFGLFF
ncbi:MAG: hypothetical protein ACFFE6_04750 [Candidatus Thorarchaeota archaeon]